MSLHPVKRSDRDKAWNNGRKQRKIRIQPEYQLIVTEGTETEPNYFNAVAETVNSNYPGRINVKVRGKGDNTLNLLESARKDVDSSLNEISHVWLVYDTDEFPAESINRTALLCEKYSDDHTTYHAIWSNQCFELWFLLHFSYLQNDLHRNEYWPKLTQWLASIGCGEYTKGRNDMFSVLYPYMTTAITHAEKLEKINMGKTPASAAPGTMVHHVLKHLKPYMEGHIS